jgi:hypothetical protein
MKLFTSPIFPVRAWPATNHDLSDVVQIHQRRTTLFRHPHGSRGTRRVPGEFRTRHS